MPADALARLEPDLHQVSLVQGDVVFEAGDPIEQIYFPQTGLISLLVVTKDGNAVEASTVGCEGAVGLQCGFGARRSFTRATAQIGGEFSTIPAARFAEVARESPPMQRLVGYYTEVLWAESQQITACNAVHQTTARLCRWLLQSADRTNSQMLPLTQEYLAQMLGVRRTTVTLLAQALQSKGLIRYSRGRISILDRSGLEAHACECYHIIRHDYLAHMIGLDQ
jgi:CRP-like cAMP-binding protein